MKTLMMLFSDVCSLCVPPEMVEGDDGEDAISTDETIGEELLAKYYKVSLPIDTRQHAHHEDRPRTSSEITGMFNLVSHFMALFLFCTVFSFYGSIHATGVLLRPHHFVHSQPFPSQGTERVFSSSSQ